MHWSQNNQEYYNAKYISLALIVYLDMWPVHAIEEHQLPYVKRLPRTKFGCRLCRIPLYKTGPCWQEHVNQLNTKD